MWECDWDTMIKLAYKYNIDQLPEKVQKNYTLLKKYNYMDTEYFKHINLFSLSTS